MPLNVTLLTLTLFKCFFFSICSAGTYSCYADDYSLAMLLKGVVQKAMNKPSQAELCFHEVLVKYVSISVSNVVEITI